MANAAKRPLPYGHGSVLRAASKIFASCKDSVVQ